jgi:hypothetical protein
MSPHVVWRETVSEHRRWLFLNAIVIAAVANAGLSALIAWGSAANEDEIPMWAAPLVEGPSLVTDTVGTFFILPFLTTLAITTAVWHELREGRIAPLSKRSSGILARLPKTRIRRGAYFGLITMLVLAPPAVLVLLLRDPGDVSVGDFVLFKAIFGVILGAIVTPPIALAAMTDEPPAAKST